MTTWWLGKDQLKGEQREILALEPGRSFLLLGPPGSGKTNLLLLKANHLYLSDHPNLAVVVFTKTLQRFIEMGANQYDFPVDKVITSRKWQQDLLQQYGVGIPVFPRDASFEQQRARLNGLIQDELIGRKRLREIFDALLIDEAHDYTPTEIETFRLLSRVLILSADTRQKIYSTPDNMETLKQATGATITLTHHYRIGRKICRVADALGEMMPEYSPMLENCQYDESIYPSAVATPFCGTIEEQGRAIVEQLAIQLDAYPEELIGVLAPTNLLVDAIWERVSNSPHSGMAVRQAGEDHPAFGLGTRICVSTIHSAKGLEFRAVHVAGAEKVTTSPQSHNLAFTAVTRAKTAVHVYHEKPLPGFFDKALRVVEPPRAVPTLDSLFGKSKRNP